MPIINKLVTDNTNEEVKGIVHYLENPASRKRAYINILAINTLINYLKVRGISVNKNNNCHNNPFILDNMDIADIKLENNIKIDVRAILNDRYPQMWVPKDHVAYGLTPDIYVAIKINPKLYTAEFAGFIESTEIDYEQGDKNYFHIDASRLRPMSDLPSAIKTITPRQSIYMPQEHNNAKELFLSYLDNDISGSNREFLVKHLAMCDNCREEFLNLCNFHAKAKSIKQENLIYYLSLKDQENAIIGVNADIKPKVEPTETKEENEESTQKSGVWNNLKEIFGNKTEKPMPVGLSSILDDMNSTEKIDLGTLDNSAALDILYAQTPESASNSIQAENETENNDDVISHDFQEIQDFNESLFVEKKNKRTFIRTTNPRGHIFIEFKPVPGESFSYLPIDTVFSDAANQDSANPEQALAHYDLSKEIEEEEIILKNIKDNLAFLAENNFDDTFKDMADKIKPYNVNPDATKSLEDSLFEPISVEYNEQLLIKKPDLLGNTIETAKELKEQYELLRKRDNSLSIVEIKDELEKTHREKQEVKDLLEQMDCIEILNTSEAAKALGSSKKNILGKRPRLIKTAAVIAAAGILGSGIVLGEYVHNKGLANKQLGYTGNTDAVAEQSPRNSTLREHLQEISRDEQAQLQYVTPNEKKNMDDVIANAFVNQGAEIKITNISWEIGVSLANDPAFKNYIMVTGQALKAALEKEMMYAPETITNNQIKIGILLDLEGNLKNSVIQVSSGSSQTDKIVLQTLKEIFSYTKLPQILTDKKNIDASIIINL